MILGPPIHYQGAYWVACRHCGRPTPSREPFAVVSCKGCRTRDRVATTILGQIWPEA